jgi:CubicO group peptidase (beta-lactamase class C family)
MRSLLLLVIPILLFARSGPPGNGMPAAPDYWPTGGWRVTTPEAQGVDSEALALAIETARQKGLSIHSLLVVRNGYLVAEAYFFPYHKTMPHDLASVTKSLTTTLAGIAIGRGMIRSVKEPMLPFFADLKIANKDERKERITLESLMTMTSGLDCKSQGGEPTLWEMLGSPNDVQHMLDLPMVAEPGANFVYCSGGMHLLSAIIARAAGRATGQTTNGQTAEQTLAFAREALLAPLGIREVLWPPDPQGVNHGFGNLHMLPRDMAKFGWLFLNQGKWDGKQIVPAEWVAAATRPQKSAGGSRDYGYGWWIPKLDPSKSDSQKSDTWVAFEASGRGGQQISVLPTKNTVIVFTGGGFPTGEVMKLVLPAIKDKPLPANPQGVVRLKKAIAAAAAAPMPGAPSRSPVVEQAISARTIRFEPNWMGLMSLKLIFPPPGQGPAAGATTAQFQFGPSLKQAQFGLYAKIRGANPFVESRPIGLDSVARFSGEGLMGLPVAAQGAWEDDHTFALEYDEIANINCYRLRLSFNMKDLEGDHGVSVQAKERTGLFDQKFSGKIEPGPTRR